MIKTYPITGADFYKTGHPPQYPDNTDLVYSNMTPRSAKHAPVDKATFDNKVVQFGLSGFIQYNLIDWWNDMFFNQPKSSVVERYKHRLGTSLSNGMPPVEHIEALHDLGFLPLKIKALPEGTRVPIGIPMFTIVNTLPNFFWLTNFVETAMSAELWKPATIATIAYEYRLLFDKWAADTGGFAGFVPFQGHDFSMRGMSGVDDAAKCGAGHLLSFLGTDTIPAIDYLEGYYQADASCEFIGGSVNATEHSVMCMGSLEGEFDTYKRLITELYPTGIISIVSDTWDYWNVLTVTIPSLKDEIMARTPDAAGFNKVVIRPDSGDPADIICGTAESFKTLDDAIAEINDRHWYEAKEACEGSYCCGNEEYTTVVLVEGEAVSLSTTFEYNRHDKEFYYIDCYGDAGLTKGTGVEATPAMLGSVQCLWNTFGGSVNEKGYKELDEHIGLIYGDSITLARAADIFKRLEAKGFASTNVVFGIGSYTYQYVTRDTFGMAVKATYGEVNGVPRELFKDPATDDGTKKSAKGLLQVYSEDGELKLRNSATPEQEAESLLTTVFEDGVHTDPQTLSGIRKRLGTL